MSRSALVIFRLFSSPEPNVPDQKVFVACHCHCCHRKTFHIFISRTTGPIPTILSTKHPWRKCFQVCSNEGPGPGPLKGRKFGKVKIEWVSLKSSSQELKTLS